MPVGFWGTRLGASVSKFDYALGEDFANLGANGDGLVKSVYAFHPLYRTRNSNVIAQLAYEDKRLHDRTDNPDVGHQRKTASSIRSKLVPSATSATASSAAVSTPSRSPTRKAT